MNPTLKTVTIGGAEYQIGQFKARVGSWILAQVLTKVLPAVIENAFAKEAGAKLASQRPAISADEFADIQGHALAVCRRVENGVPMPVFVHPDTFAIKELEYDLVTVTALTVHALLANLTPFFADGGLKELMMCLPSSLALNSSIFPA